MTPEAPHSEPRVDRQAIAEQVIVSAGNVLRAAGFGREEIGSFFRQAADLLEGRSAADDAGSGEARDAPNARAVERLLIEFQAIPPVRELVLLQKRLEAEPGGGEAAMAGAFRLAMEMVPHIGAAQDWLRGRAEEADLAVAAARGDRDAGPSAAGPDDRTLYLDDFETVYADSFALLARLFRALGESGAEREFRLLLVKLVECDVTITPDLKETIETWIEHVA